MKQLQKKLNSPTLKTELINIRGTAKTFVGDEFTREIPDLLKKLDNIPSDSEGIDELAQKDSRVLAITAAMPDGTGLMEFREKFPDRFIDAGIAEQHAVALSSGLATAGMRPVAARTGRRS